MTCQLVLLLDTRRIEFEPPEDGLLEGSWSGLLGRKGTHDEHRNELLPKSRLRRYAVPARYSGQKFGPFF